MEDIPTVRSVRYTPSLSAVNSFYPPPTENIVKKTKLGPIDGVNGAKNLHWWGCGFRDDGAGAMKSWWACAAHVATQRESKPIRCSVCTEIWFFSFEKPKRCVSTLKAAASQYAFDWCIDRERVRLGQQVPQQERRRQGKMSRSTGAGTCVSSRHLLQ